MPRSDRMPVGGTVRVRRQGRADEPDFPGMGFCVRGEHSDGIHHHVGSYVVEQ